MKKQKIAILTVSVALITSIVAVKKISSNTSELRKNDFTLPEGFTVTAHTGCEGERDNTLESIRAGAQAGADIVEIDLHFLSDGTPVLCHDTPKETKISEEMPSLESAFLLLSKLDVKMNVDVKSTANLSAVAELSDKSGVTGKIFFTGVEEKDVEAVKSATPDIPYYLNVSVEKKKNTDAEYLKTLVDKVKNCGAIGINMNFKHCSEELVEAFRGEGLLVSVWTANSKRDMLKSLSLSPDNITTRKPSMLKVTAIEPNES